MSLATPSKIRELQIKLVSQGEERPGYRFYMLYDKVYREDILAHAYALAKSTTVRRVWRGRASRTSNRREWRGG